MDSAGTIISIAAKDLIMQSKTPQDSAVEMREMVMPHHANPQNTVFGGTIMSWIDIAAAMVAARHCNRPVVTAHISDIDFIAPVRIGYHVHILASMNYVGRSSMVVGVKVVAENPMTGERRTTTKAYLTFVALDDMGKPTEVPSLTVQTSDEERRFKNAQERAKAKKRLKQKLK
jgi:acyl-CoA hydrolase